MRESRAATDGGAVVPTSGVRRQGFVRQRLWEELIRLLYSIIPPEVILDDSPAGPQTTREVHLAPGVRLLLRRDPAGEWVERVISTDPRHYLNPDLVPGTLYRPELRG